jgi:hypothetical protein
VAASSPTPDRNEDLILDSHCRPAFGDPLPLDHTMRLLALLGPVAHHEPGLAARGRRLATTVASYYIICGSWLLPARRNALAF